MSRRAWAVAIVVLCLVAGTVLAQNAARPSGKVVDHSKRPSVLVAVFPIKFMGRYPQKQYTALADIVKSYDLVFIEGIVVPPFVGAYPDGTPYAASPGVAQFFEVMRKAGFEYRVSAGDTGGNPKTASHGSPPVWYAAFFRPEKMQPVQDLFNGYLAEPRYGNKDFERVPYAFPFRIGNADIVFINAYLQPGKAQTQTQRRAHELKSIESWIESQETPEKDYVVLGSFNMEDCDELGRVMPEHYQSLNAICKPTNTDDAAPKPYDHVLYHNEYSKEIDHRKGLDVLDIVPYMRKLWKYKKLYPGDPYQPEEYPRYYSDRQPVVFRVFTDKKDDD